MKGTIAQRIRVIFGRDADDALAVANLASGLDARALNRSDSGAILRGLFQIPSIYDGKEYPLTEIKTLFDPDFNIQVAKNLFDRFGWGWSETARDLGIAGKSQSSSAEFSEAERTPVVTTFTGSAMTDVSGTSVANPSIVSPASWIRRKALNRRTTSIAFGAMNTGEFLYAVAGADGAIWTSQSPEGPWTAQSSGLSGYITAIRYGTLYSGGPKGFVACDENCAISYTTDGINWTSYIPTVKPNPTDVTAYGGGSWTTMATNGVGRWVFFMSYLKDWQGCLAFYTDNATDPTGRVSSGFTKWGRLMTYSDDPAYDAAYNNGTWVVVGGSAGIYTSVDGISWVNRTPSVLTATTPYPDLYTVTVTNFGGTSWVAAGQRGRMVYTTDPNTAWNLGPAMFGGTDVNQIATDGSRWVAIGDNYDAAYPGPPYGGPFYPTGRMATASGTVNSAWTEVDEGNTRYENWWIGYRYPTWILGGGSAGFISTATSPTLGFNSVASASNQRVLSRVGGSIKTQKSAKSSGSTTVDFYGYKEPTSDDASKQGFPVVEFVVAKDPSGEVVAKTSKQVTSVEDGVLASLQYSASGDDFYRYFVNWTGGSTGEPPAETVFAGSPAGIIWSTVESGTTYNINGIGRSDPQNLWVAVGYNGTILTSTDALSWKTQSSPTYNTLWDVTYSPKLNLWIAVGNNYTILRSYNGTSWTSTYSGSSYDEWYSVVWSELESQFVVTGEYSYYSKAIYATSSDGVTFTKGGLPTYGDGGVPGVARSESEDRWLAPYSNNYRIAQSSNGTSWTDISISPSFYDYPSGIAYSSTLSQWALTTWSGDIYTSSNGGQTWSRRRTGDGYYLWGLSWSTTEKLWVAIGESGRIFTSPDGVQWTQRSGGTTRSFNLVANSVSQRRFVAVADYGVIAVSSVVPESRLGGIVGGGFRPIISKVVETR